MMIFFFMGNFRGWRAGAIGYVINHIIDPTGDGKRASRQTPRKMCGRTIALPVVAKTYDISGSGGTPMA
jgi:hypothetical protein